MKRTLLTLAFAAAMAAQSYGGRPAYTPAAPQPIPQDRYAYADRSGTSFADRIRRGERDGLLSPREASRLWAMERDLRWEMDRANRSGFGMSHMERIRVTEMSMHLDQAIRADLQNGERLYRVGPRRW
jgi:hypothetical protein